MYYFLIILYHYFIFLGWPRVSDNNIVHSAAPAREQGSLLCCVCRKSRRQRRPNRDGASDHSKKDCDEANITRRSSNDTRIQSRLGKSHLGTSRRQRGNDIQLPHRETRGLAFDLGSCRKRRRERDVVHGSRPTRRYRLLFPRDRRERSRRIRPAHNGKIVHTENAIR